MKLCSMCFSQASIFKLSTMCDQAIDNLMEMNLEEVDVIPGPPPAEYDAYNDKLFKILMDVSAEFHLRTPRPLAWLG